MIVLYLLVLGSRPRLCLKVLLGLILVLIFPFCFQSTHYVIQQYYDSWLNFTSTINIGVHTKIGECLFDAIKVFGLGLSHGVINIVILFMAVVTYIYVLYMSKKIDFKSWVWSLAFMSVVYLLLFNPRTESNGYILLAPFLGFAFTEAYLSKNYNRVLLLSVIGFMIALNYDISRNLIMGTTSWVAPLVTVIFVIYWIYFVDFRNTNSIEIQANLEKKL